MVMTKPLPFVKKGHDRDATENTIKKEAADKMGEALKENSTLTELTLISEKQNCMATTSTTQRE